jgi:hypothetical protein
MSRRLPKNHKGTLPTDAVLGRRCEETGEIFDVEWSTIFQLTDVDNPPLSPQALPLVITLETPLAFCVQGLDGISGRIEHMALPLQK